MSVTYHPLRGAPVIHPMRFATGYNADGQNPLGVNVGAFNWRDVIGQLLGVVCIDHGPTPVEPLMAVYYSRGPTGDVVVNGQKPKTTPYDGALDWQRYGSFLDSIFTAGRVVAGNPPSNFSLGREKNVTHAQPSGVFRIKTDCVPLFTHTGDVANVTCSVAQFQWTLAIPLFHELVGLSPWHHVYSSLVPVNSFGGWEYSLSGISGDTGTWAHPRCELRTFLAYIADHIYDSYSFYQYATLPWGDWHSVVTNDFAWSEHDGVIHISYLTVWSTGHLGGGHVTFKTNIYLNTEVAFVEPTGHETGLTRGLICSPTLGVATRDVVDGTPALLNAWFPELHREDVLQYGIPWAFSTVGHEVYSGSVHPAVKLTARKPWLLHKQRIQANATDIRYSAFISTADALDSSTLSVNNDVWQTLVKLPELADQIPDFKEAVRLMQALNPAKLISIGASSATLKDLVDYATELRLTQQFEWRPEFDLITTLGPKMLDTFNEVQRLIASLEKDEVILRGRYDYDFPSGVFGYPATHLTTHSRVAVESSGFRHLDSLLLLKATGFSPLPSTLWDLTPFSFVANWFTGVAPRIRDLESVALVGAIGIRCLTHSFLVESLPNDSEIEVFGLDQSVTPGSEPLKWRFYAREVSLHLPPPRIGRFDFRYPTRLPDWATAGSLVWQVFRI